MAANQLKLSWNKSNEYSKFIDLTMHKPEQRLIDKKQNPPEIFDFRRALNVFKI